MTKVCGSRHRRKADPSSCFALLQNRRATVPGEALRAQEHQEHSASLRMHGQEGQESSAL